MVNSGLIQNISGKALHKISILNSTSALLLAGATFTGAWEDVSGFTTASVSISGNLSVEPGTLYFDVSHDGISVAGTISADIPNAIFFDKPHILNIAEKFIRIRYEDGGVDQTVFGLQTKYSNGQELGLLHSMGDEINPLTEGQIVKSVITGQDPNGNYVNNLSDGYVVSSVTTTPLGSGGIFTSGIMSTDGYSQIATELLSDQDGVLVGSWYSDEAGTDLIRTFIRPFAASGGYAFFAAPVFGPYLKYTYTNGAAPQADFYISLKLFTKSISGQILGLNDFVSPNMAANLGRNIITGQDSQGAFRNINANALGQLKVDVANPITAFGDLRVAELTPQVQLTFPYNINLDIVDVTELNGGTVTQVDSKAVLQTSAASNGSALMQSNISIKYRAGLGILARFTGMFTTGVANSIQEIGPINGENGFGFGYDGTSFGILRKYDGTRYWILQADWNADKMDGTGPSGMTIDATVLNVFAVPIQYLGAGAINFYIESQYTGEFVLVHQIDWANTNTTPHILNPSLPLRCYVENNGNTSNLTLSTSSMAGFVEGKNIPTGPTNSFANTKTHSTETALFSIRNKANYQGKVNKVEVILKTLSVGNDVNKLATFTIYRNTVLGGSPVWNDISTNTSVIEVDVAGTTVSGGRAIFSGTVGKDSGQVFNLTVLGEYGLVLAPGDTYTITSKSASAEAMSASVTWQDDF